MAKERRGIHLIAELAHVSIGTVDRALHGRAGINDSTRQRILQIARQVGYAPNLAARALSVAKANTKIGVCVPREIHFFYDQLWNGILEEARQAAHLGIQFVNRPVQVLGRVSYSLYLVHIPIGIEIANFLWSLSDKSFLVAVGCAGMAVVGSLLAAWLILFGVLTAPFLNLGFAHSGDILALLAIAAGVVLLLQR